MNPPQDRAGFEAREIYDWMHLLMNQPWEASSKTMFRCGPSIRFRIPYPETNLPREPLQTLLMEPVFARTLATKWVLKHLKDIQPLALGMLGSEKTSREDCPREDCLWEIADMKPPEIYMLLSISPVLVQEITEKLSFYGRSPPKTETSKNERSDPSEKSPAEKAWEERNGFFQEFQAWLDGIPVLTPLAMDERLTQLGYTGQSRARKAVCVFAFRHLRRLRSLHLDGTDPKQLPARENLLLAGPSGSGKTFLIQLLFQEILKFPTVIVDVTGYTASGYVGYPVSAMPKLLMHAADYDPFRASTGIICLDEFDKLASPAADTAAHRCGGLDITGYGVQKELLKFMEGDGSSAVNPEDLFSTETFDLSWVPFVAMGSFSGLDLVGKSCAAQSGTIGFGEQSTQSGSTVLLDSDLLQTYGFMPELIGRFARVASLDVIPKDQLHEIFENQVLKKYAVECAKENLELLIAPAARDLIVNHAYRAGLGARGLRAAFESCLEDVFYEAYSKPETRCIQISVHQQRLKVQLQ
ncbi:MAG: AAA family ATPase [Verrucomicrobia bacterium]|nr:AAA family ATPase [Verrucomicrobiota bacterium]MCH8510364.1 AAA family ATPase [Kiritimatiellia bacterium]